MINQFALSLQNSITLELDTEQNNNNNQHLTEQDPLAQPQMELENKCDSWKGAMDGLKSPLEKLVSQGGKMVVIESLDFFQGLCRMLAKFGGRIWKSNFLKISLE